MAENIAAVNWLAPDYWEIQTNDGLFHGADGNFLGVRVSLVQEEDGKEGSHHQKRKQHIPALAECHIQGKIADQLKQKNQSVLNQSKKTNLLRILLQQQVKGKNRICKDNGDDAVFG